MAKVQVRVKAIADRKVSLSMISSADETDKQSSFGDGNSPQLAENKEWRQAMASLEQPKFVNAPVIVDLRK
jgi:hypothetical protein